MPTDEAVEEIYGVIKKKLVPTHITPLVVTIANVANGLQALMKGELELDKVSGQYYTTGKAIHERIKQIDTSDASVSARVHRKNS